MKKSKEELKQTIVDMVQDEDVQIALLEDIEDSMDIETEVDNTDLEEYKTKYEELKTKYKERFLKGDEKTEDKKDDQEEMKEEEVVEKEDIFEKVEEE